MGYKVYIVNLKSKIDEDTIQEKKQELQKMAEEFGRVNKIDVKPSSRQHLFCEIEFQKKNQRTQFYEDFKNNPINGSKIFDKPYCFKCYLKKKITHLYIDCPYRSKQQRNRNQKEAKERKNSEVRKKNEGKAKQEEQKIFLQKKQKNNSLKINYSINGNKKCIVIENFARESLESITFGDEVLYSPSKQKIVIEPKRIIDDLSEIESITSITLEISSLIIE